MHIVQYEYDPIESKLDLIVRGEIGHMKKSVILNQMSYSEIAALLDVTVQSYGSSLQALQTGFVSSNDARGHCKGLRDLISIITQTQLNGVGVHATVTLPIKGPS